MFIISLIRFLVGYVTFTAYGGFPERFINLCTKNRIPLWNLKNEQKRIVANTTVKGYKRIRGSARKSGVRVRVAEKHGLPFFLNKNKMRKGFVIGIALAMTAVALMSTRIWVITVEGNREVSDEQVLAVFESLGVKTGASKSSLTASDIAYEAARLIDEVAWASLNIKGSRAEIIISERTPAPEFPETGIPCNIVAEEDGVITEIEAYTGEAAVKVSDAVVKGDLLISGVTVNLDKTESFKAARGNVYARVEKTIIITACDDEFMRQSEEKTKYTLFLLGLKLPLSFGVGESNYYKTESYLSDGEIKLPVGVIKEHSYKTDALSPMPAEMKNLYSAKRFIDEYKLILKSSEIESSRFSSGSQYSLFSFSGKYTVIQEIGRKSEIFVEKN